MSAVLGLVRPDLAGFAGYSSARSHAHVGDVWLNANEAPWRNGADAGAAWRRYPDPQPAALREALAALYGCTPEQVLAGRGSDEAIDLLVRALCVPGQGSIVTTPPTFGMYAVSARLHGVAVEPVPLLDTPEGLACDFDVIARRVEATGARIVFLCSPGNPGGNLLDGDEVLALARRLAGRALVVVDEAYQEYAQAPSLVRRLAEASNLAILRTLSKAHALAGVRMGCVVADAGLIEVLRRCQAPYPMPEPCTRAVLEALAPGNLAQTRANVEETIAARDRLAEALANVPGVLRVWPSRANFVLVRFADADAAFARLLATGIVVRDMQAQVPGALRITAGTRLEVERVIGALQP